jgi:uncharacterized protein YcbX
MSLLWHVHQFFFHLKVQIPTEMPRKDVIPTHKIALLEKIKNQLPNTSHCQLVEVTPVPKSTTAHIIQQQEKRQDERTLGHGQQTDKWKQETKDPDAEEALNQWFSIVIGQSVSEELAKRLGHNDFKA